MKYFIKSIFFTHLLFLTNLEIAAQQGEIKYLFSEPENDVIFRPVLTFNDSVSLFVYNRVGFDSPSYNGGSIKEDGSLQMKIGAGDKEGSQIFTDFGKKSIIYRKAYSEIVDAYVVNDNWVDIDWDIETKTKKIGKYTATKAVGTFRGREYTAWFTYDIPLPIGPWKLNGLPGAILEVMDKEGAFEVKLVSINYPMEEIKEIKKPFADKEMTLKEHIYIGDNIDDILLKMIKSRMPAGMKGKITYKKKTLKQRRKQYKERVYEWELDD